MKKFLLLIAALVAGSAVNAQTKDVTLSLYKYDFDAGSYNYYGDMVNSVTYSPENLSYAFNGFLGLIGNDENVTFTLGEEDPDFGCINVSVSGPVTESGSYFYVNSDKAESARFVNPETGEVATISDCIFYSSPYTCYYPAEEGYEEELDIYVYASLNQIDGETVTTSDADDFVIMAALPSPEDFAPIKNVVEDAVDANAPVEFFNLQGIKVANPAAGQIYIRRQGNMVSKIMR